jgi:hypothetical protein
LRELIIKGFTLDDERLKQAGGGNYFDELLERIRDIRSSEKVFWKKVLEIYATSIDYDPGVESSKSFFATVQNKMHWAAHGQTAAEVVATRVDASEPNMGLTTWSGERPRKADVSVAKNYLNEEELGLLNRIVTAYLEFAELQASSRKPWPIGSPSSKTSCASLTERFCNTPARSPTRLRLPKPSSSATDMQLTNAHCPLRWRSTSRKRSHRPNSSSKNGPPRK